MSNVENLSPQIIRRVVKEMNDLVNEPPEGIKVNINDEDITDIQAYIEGPGSTMLSYFIWDYSIFYDIDLCTAAYLSTSFLICHPE